MIIEDTFRLPFSEGHPWIVRLLKKYTKKASDREAFIVSQKLYQEILEKAEDIQTVGLPPNLYLAHVSSKVNAGIFLKPESDPISPGSLIGVYTGLYELVESDTSVGTSYSYDVAQELSLKKEELQYVSRAKTEKARGKEYSIQTNAFEKGNFTRYINHSSLETNIEAVVSKLPNGTMEILLFCLKKIHPGEQLLSNYGGPYWKTLEIIPDDIRPSTYILNHKHQVKVQKKPKALSAQVQKILSPLRNASSSISPLLEKKEIFKKLKKQIPKISKKEHKELDAFDEIVAERGIPRKWKLSPTLKGFKVRLEKKENSIPSRSLIGVLSGSFSLKPSKTSFLIASYKKTKLFFNPSLDGNFLSQIQSSSKKGNFQIKLAWDNEKELIQLLAVSTHPIKAGDELLLKPFEPISFS